MMVVFILQVPALNFGQDDFSLWGSGEWWMLLAAQSMAVGTVMVRWVSKYSDPVMATGWVCSCIRKYYRANHIIGGSLTGFTASDKQWAN